MMKNPNLIHSGIDEYTIPKDGRKQKKRHKGQLDESFNHVSLTHDDDPKPSVLREKAAVHDEPIVGYNTAWRKMKNENTM